jgi:hypothetical protein
MSPIRPAAATPGDDLPVFDEAPLRTFDLAPRAIQPGRTRGSLIAVAWAAGLALVVGVGVLAGASGTTPGAVREGGVGPQLGLDLPGGRVSQRRPEAHSPPGPPWPAVGETAMREATAPARVELSTPTRAVVVEGTMLVRAARVDISLETRTSRVLDRVSVDVSDVHGGIRPERAASFNARFNVPESPLAGTLWIVVTAYDTDGRPVGGTRRPFAVGRA